MNPALDSLLDSTNLTNAIHIIELEFVNASGVVVATSPVLPGHYRFRVGNNRCIGVLAAPSIGTMMADNCGILRYTSTVQVVTMGLTASHPNNFATFSSGSFLGDPSLPETGRN